MLQDKDLIWNEGLSICCANHEGCVPFINGNRYVEQFYNGINYRRFDNESPATRSNCVCDNNLRLCLSNGGDEGAILWAIYARVTQACLVYDTSLFPVEKKFITK